MAQGVIRGLSPLLLSAVVAQSRQTHMATGKEKIGCLCLIVLTLAIFVGLRWLNTTPSSRAQQYRDKLPFRLAALQKTRNDLELRLVLTREELGNVRRDLDALMREVRARPDASEILAESKHILEVASRGEGQGD